MKPKPGTIQWIAPHLSEGEVKAMYEAVLSKVVGEDVEPNIYESLLQTIQMRQNALKAIQRGRAATLFGMDNK